jgi:hypothetical protein
LNTTVFKYYDIIMVYHGIFYISLTNTYLKIRYYKSWYLVVICKKKASHSYNFFRLEWSFNYSKNNIVSSKLWYWKERVLHASQTSLENNIMVFFNIMILSQNFKNTLFSCTPYRPSSNSVCKKTMQHEFIHKIPFLKIIRNVFLRLYFSCFRTSPKDFHKLP